MWSSVAFLGCVLAFMVWAFRAGKNSNLKQVHKNVKKADTVRRKPLDLDKLRRKWTR